MARCAEMCALQVCTVPVLNLSAEEQGSGCGTGLCGLKETPLPNSSLCISSLGLPVQQKADNGPTYMSKLLEEFCNFWDNNYVSLLSLEPLTTHRMGSSYCRITQIKSGTYAHLRPHLLCCTQSSCLQTLSFQKMLLLLPQGILP